MTVISSRTRHGTERGAAQHVQKKIVEESLRMESRRSSYVQTSMKRTQRNQQQTGPSIPRFVIGWGLFLWCCMTRIPTIEAALDADQLQAWQAFYDGVSGMSSCSKCNKRNDPCSCSSSYLGCSSDGKKITKINLFECGLSGKSAYRPFLIIVHGCLSLSLSAHLSTY